MFENEEEEDFSEPTYRILEADNVMIGFYEPGNGTRYSAMAIRLWERVTFGSLGSVTDGWLVVNGFNAKAYLFQANDQPLADEYIREKLGGLPGDYPYFGDLVRKLLGRPSLGGGRSEKSTNTP